MWEKGNLHSLLVGVQTGAAVVENSVEVSQNIKNSTALWPNNSTSGYLSEEIQNMNLKRHMYPYVYSSQDMEAT